MRKAENRTASTDAGFAVKDSALIAAATGIRVQSLHELRRGLREAPQASLYHHFWGGLLQSRFEEREYNNDFAAWVRHGLHDAVLAERLAVVDPTGFDDLEDLRAALLDRVEERLDEAEYLYWVRATQRFEFIRSRIVVFDTRRTIRTPEELAALLPSLSTGSVFYHVVDARRRDPVGQDDFRFWLAAFGERYAALCEELAGVDPYFGGLTELREQLAALFSAHLEEI